MQLQRTLLIGGVGAALTAATLLGINAPRHGSTAAAQTANARTTLRDQAGNTVGMALFTQQAGKVLVQAEGMNMPPGFHGFHVHAVGNCDPATSFNSAGGHFQVASMHHHHSEHTGDMPSLYINGDGTGGLSIITDQFSIDDLFAGGQRALIVHADKDNFAHIPARYGVEPDEMTLNTGDAGARLACGVIERT